MADPDLPLVNVFWRLVSHISDGIIDPPSVFIVVIPTIGTLLIGVKGAFLSSFYAIWQIDT